VSLKLSEAQTLAKAGDSETQAAKVMIMGFCYWKGALNVLDQVEFPGDWLPNLMHLCKITYSQVGYTLANRLM
jgi:hypothetical protein